MRNKSALMDAARESDREPPLWREFRTVGLAVRATHECMIWVRPGECGLLARGYRGRRHPVEGALDRCCVCWAASATAMLALGLDWVGPMRRG